MSGYTYYFNAVAIDHFSARGDAAALRYVRARYREATGRIVPVGSTQDVYVRARRESLAAIDLKVAP